MASLRRHPKSPFYVACFTGADGKRYQRSTRIKADGKVESRRQAQRIANEYEDVARRKHTARQVQRVFQEVYKEVTGEHLPDQTVSAFATEWLKDKKGSVTEGTYAFYKSRAESFLGSIGDRAEGPMYQVTERDIRAWRDAEAERVSVTTTNHGLKVLRMLFGDAKKQNIMADNPAELIPVIKKAGRADRRRPFTKEELRRLFAILTGEWLSLVVFGLYTGQRLGDLARLKLSDIDLVANEIRFKTSKTGREQKIPICRPLLEHIKSLPCPISTSLPVHPAAAAVVERSTRTGTLSVQFHDLMAKAGLVEKRPHRKRHADDQTRRRRASALSFHSLRHTTTSLLKNAGVSSAIAEEIIGHDSAEMNRHYTHIDGASLQAAVDLLPDFRG
jgi:integrase